VAELSIVERVQNGAKWLDENHPGWASRIDVSVLDIGSCDSCVLGQLFEGYEAAPYASTNTANGAFVAPERGFTWYVRDADPPLILWKERYAELTAEWKRLIESRRTAVILDA
jgi:hypothetical protein